MKSKSRHQYTRFVVIVLIIGLLWFFLFWLSGDLKLPGLRGANDINVFIQKNLKFRERLTDTDMSVHSHLIIVPGHAVLRLYDSSQTSLSSSKLLRDSSWMLLDYQLNKDLPTAIASHLRTGIDILESDSNSILVLTGGQTRIDAGPVSESLGYLLAARLNGWLYHDVHHRFVFLEEFARDSLENLLFSVCRFREVTGKYPRKITIVGFDFKQKRYSELHRRALRWLRVEDFKYIGLSPGPLFDKSSAEKGEKETEIEFERDLYGCGETLMKKKNSRNPFQRQHPYGEKTCPEMSEIINMCDGEGESNVSLDETEIWKRLPWNRDF